MYMEGDSVICEVLLEIKFKNDDKTFTYHVPKTFEQNIEIGKRVTVPFSNRILEGFVINIHNDYKTEYPLKDIISIIDEEPVLTSELLELGNFIKKKTFCNLINAYQAMLPTALKVHHGKKISKKYEKYLVLTNDYENAIHNIKNSKQLEIINLFKDRKEILKKEGTDISSSSVKTLIDKKILTEIEKESYRINDLTEQRDLKKNLTKEQENAVKEIESSFSSFQPFLLHGVTGSGKTEVYMQLIEKVLNNNKEALVLVPEISLTPQFVSNFKKRFGNKIAILHSRLSNGEKYDEWRKIINKEVSIVIGARSAVFAPLTNLGIIIVDEEHSSTYKQENNPRYHAIDVCLFRAKNYNIPLVLGSATPSIECYTRAVEGIYKLIELKQRVFTNLPKVTLNDMKEEIRKGNRILSGLLIEELNNCIKNNKQAIILLNRRGFSTVLTCSNCGTTIKCPSCDIPLTYHKSSNTMKCHYCGYTSNKPNACPHCSNKDINYLGMGTEKLQSWIDENIVGAKTIRMDVDTTSRKGSLEKIIEKFQNKECNILIGTQMISKGLDFSDVTLVGVVCGDSSLNIPDFRSAERTFSLLDQVSGRAGRGVEEGRVIIQGFNMEHYSIVCASNHDYLKFYKEEMNIRKTLKYPPYCNICLLKLKGKDYDKLYNEANKITNHLKNNLSKVIILGPSNAIVPKINNIYYMNIIIKYKKIIDIQKDLLFLKDMYINKNHVDLDIDFNPNQI